MDYQDNYMEEAFKMRNLLQEFLKKRDGGRFPSILGVREHIFTGRLVISIYFEIPLLLKSCNYNILISANSDSSLFCSYSVSSLAWFMSNQEISFVTIAQRFLANPLK